MRRKARELRVDEDKKPCRDFSLLIGTYSHQGCGLTATNGLTASNKGGKIGEDLIIGADRLWDLIGMRDFEKTEPATK